MHIIDDASPLRAQSAESLRGSSSSVSGTDETTGQVLMARAEYPSTAIRWNKAFQDILEVTDDGTLYIDYGKFHEVEPLTTPQTDSSGKPMPNSA